MTTQVTKAIKVLSIIANYDVTDSMSINCKNYMWTEITNICRLRTVRMPQVSKCKLA